jgi:hypothetical protein
MAQVQTIEGISDVAGSSTCMVVRNRGDGVCQCAAFGPVTGATHPTFEELCEQKGLLVAVGKQKKVRKQMSGLGYYLGESDDEAMMEYPALESLGMPQDFGPDFFGLGQLVSREMLQVKAVAALAGAGGILAVSNALNMINYFADKPRWKAGAAIALGVLGGMGLYRVSEAAALGFVGGVAGQGVASLVGSFANIQSSLGAVEVTNTPAYNFFSPNRGPLPQLGQPIVTEDDPLALSGFDAVEVTEEQLGSWIG